MNSFLTVYRPQNKSSGELCSSTHTTTFARVNTAYNFLVWNSHRKHLRLLAPWLREGQTNTVLLGYNHKHQQQFHWGARCGKAGASCCGGARTRPLSATAATTAAGGRCRGPAVPGSEPPHGASHSREPPPQRGTAGPAPSRGRSGRCRRGLEAAAGLGGRSLARWGRRWRSWGLPGGTGRGSGWRRWWGRAAAVPSREQGCENIGPSPWARVAAAGGGSALPPSLPPCFSPSIPAPPCGELLGWGPSGRAGLGWGRYGN